MIKIAILVVAAILIILFIIKYQDNQKVSNTTILNFLALLLALIGIYQFSVTKFQDRVTMLLNSYKSGEALICNGQEISNKDYSYQSGTMVFISKKKVIDKIPIIDCKLK
jgi:hypothetical membrane protein